MKSKYIQPKKAFHLLLMVFILSLSLSSCKTYYLDENGNSIEPQVFAKKWHDPNSPWARWDYKAKDSGEVAILNVPQYETYTSSYSKLVEKLENLTHRKFEENAIFIIKYHYLNDFCLGSESSNSWNRFRLKNKKKGMDFRTENLKREFKNIALLVFFEKGFKLKRGASTEEKYFFIDSTKFFRNNIFKNPTLCGSFCVIRPSGEILVRNGEYSTHGIALHLNPKVWNKIFPE